MEYFGARDDVPLETCLSQVRASDILVVILAHRYGSLVPGEEISYTEAEYREGHRLKMPCLVYIRHEDEPVLPRYVERDPAGRDALARFKKLVQKRHTVKDFRDPSDLAVGVAADLARTVHALEDDAHVAAAPPSDPIASRVRLPHPSRYGLRQEGVRICFVAMPYHQEFDAVWNEAIIPAFNHPSLPARLRCVRADQVQKPGVIRDQIDHLIENSLCVLADITDSNPNVMHEVGIAETQHKPVVLMTAGDSELPFNVRHMRVIFYEATAAGLRRLRDRLVASVLAVLESKLLPRTALAPSLQAIPPPPPRSLPLAKLLPGAMGAVSPMPLTAADDEGLQRLRDCQSTGKAVEAVGDLLASPTLAVAAKVRLADVLVRLAS